jgi:hypothetical protein
MKYTSKTRHLSKSCDGVAFTIRHLTEGRRIDLSMKLAGVYEKIDALRTKAGSIHEKLKPVIERAKAGELEDAALSLHPDVIAASAIQRQIDAVESCEIMPVYVRALLHSVEEMEIDDVPATPETIIEGPPELYAEITAVIRKELGLTPAEEGNSESPTISSAPGQATNPTTAEPANAVETGAIAAASDILAA